jgi:two-component system LytT family response regulator
MIDKIRSVIVEDEAAAREVLKNYLSKYCPQVEVVGEAHNFKEAVPLLHDLTPQLVFLDVEMPFGNAFDVLEACKDLHFETIFVTAFSEYSLRALNQSAAYYLLKPISIEELILAVSKVHQQLINQVIFNRNKIIVENFHEKQPEKQQVIVCRFLKHFSEILPLPFIRVHKSHIINLHFVKAYNKGGYVTMNDESEIEVSATYKEEFLRRFR